MVSSLTRRLRSGTVAIACLLAACGDDDPVTPPPPPPLPPAWSEIASMPPSFTAYALWAPAPDYVIAAGPRGQVHRWDGQRWADVETETGRNLYAIAGDAAGPIVVVGDDGVAMRFSSTRFVVIPPTTSEDLRGVWMAARDDFFAAGDAGTVLRGDGDSWTLQESGTAEPLFAIWGASATDVFAAGMNGTIRRFDGVSWTAMNSGTGAVLQSVCATGTTMAVGGNGTILSLGDGGAWEPHAGVTDAWLYAVARADDRAWIAGTNAVLFRDGATWGPVARGAVPVLRAVAAESGSGAILTGGENGYLARGAGDRWHMEDTGDMRTIHDLWESDDGGMFAVGTNRILRREGAMWVVESGEIGEFFDIDGRENAIFAVGSEGRIRMRTPSGWSHFGILTPLAIYGIAVVSANEAYAVGEGGWIGRYNGITWQSMTSFTSRDLFNVIAMPGNAPRAVAATAA